MAEEKRPAEHSLTLHRRENLTVTGVTEVVSFDETAVVLRTQMGTLIIQGSGLQLKGLSLDGGKVAVDGTVNAMVYEQTRTGGFLGRLLR